MRYEHLHVELSPYAINNHGPSITLRNGETFIVTRRSRELVALVPYDAGHALVLYLNALVDELNSLDADRISMSASLDGALSVLNALLRSPTVHAELQHVAATDAMARDSRELR
jgi:hypothetical protein